MEFTDIANALIETERLMLPNQDSKRIYIGGMSQGALSSIDVLLRYNGTTPLGGVVIESGTMSLEEQYRLTSPEALEVQGNTPMWAYHGSVDKVINQELSNESYAYLRDVVYKNYPDNYSYQIEQGMGHWISDVEKYKVYAWLADKIAKQSP